jgi:aminopeptidase N
MRTWTGIPTGRIGRVGATCGAVLALGLASSAAAAPQSTPVPGAPGIGDPLFPELGNGGYDVEHYGLDLDYRGARGRRVGGHVAITAKADRALSRFDLDFAGGRVSRVTVDGVAADWDREDEELIVWPEQDLADGADFRVDVSFRPEGPQPLDPDALTQAWIQTADGSVTAGQPNFSHAIFPSNDHPSDKASYTIALTVPQSMTAVANGVLAERATHGRRTTWTYEQRQPMATELIQLAVGDLDVTDRGTGAGVPLRDVTPRAFTAQIAPTLATEGEQIRWLQDRVGPYPFDLYGVLAADVDIQFALETQTLSLFPAQSLIGRQPESIEPVLVHELAHQWFGDSVAPALWRDVWLNEGHATWYEFEYELEKFPNVPDRGYQSLDELMRFIYAAGDQLRADGGPVARPKSGDVNDLFNANVYEGGALVLYALRQEVGDAAFRQIERGWVQRYENGVAGTPDFIRFASRVAGRDLRAFLRAWLYGTTTPPMPGHPDWTVDPVEQEPGQGAQVTDAARRADALARGETGLLRR